MVIKNYSYKNIKNLVRTILLDQQKGIKHYCDVNPKIRTLYISC